MDSSSMDFRMSVLPTAKHTFNPAKGSMTSPQGLQQPYQGGSMEIIAHFNPVMVSQNRGQIGGKCSCGK